MQLKLNKLAALFLFTSQGISMIHSGQEFARTKIVQPVKGLKDSHAGMLDHNSYNKDNETNYINFDYAGLNSELLLYYQGLIEMRKKYDAFRHADYSDITFFDFKDNPFAVGYFIDYKDQDFIVLFNADPSKNLTFLIPGGQWNVIANGDQAGIEPIATAEGELTLPPSTGIVLIR
jgi:pullulanase/glycogen debranching enzyme